MTDLTLAQAEVAKQDEYADAKAASRMSLVGCHLFGKGLMMLDYVDAVSSVLQRTKYSETIQLQ